MARSPISSIDYSARDWDSIRGAIFDYLRKKFPNDWTDFSESNLGVALVEVVAYAFEILSFSLDRAVNENFISTAQERQSVIKLAALLGYKLSSATAASTSLVISNTTLSGLASPIRIAGGTSVPAGDLTFEVDQDYTIVKNPATSRWSVNGGPEALTAKIGAIQGQTVSNSFVSDGSKFQVFKTSKLPYIDKTVLVTVDGVQWQQVESMVLGDATDQTNQKIYETLLDKDDRLSIKFGDSVTGDIPSQGAQIVVYQRIGGGSVGNIASGVISTELPCTANSVGAKVAVTNLAASGGTDRESIEHARAYAPAWGRTTDRAITYADYLALCNGFSDGSNGRIAKAGVIAQPTDGISNVVTVYAWSEDAQGNLTTVSQPLKDSLRSFLNDRKVITVFVSPIQDGQNVPIDLDILLSVYSGFDKKDIERQCGLLLQSLFASNQVRYENQLRMSWIHDYLTSLPGVKSINIRSPKPQTITTTIAEIEAGVLPSQTGAGVNQIIISVPSARVTNYYVNYNIVVNYNVPSGISTLRKVIQSTAIGGAGNVTLTLSQDNDPTIVAGASYTFRHPRRIAITLPTSHPTEADVKNKRVVFYQPIGGVDDVERSAVEYVETDSVGLITIDRDYRSVPITGRRLTITPDYFVSSTRAITLGTVSLEVEDEF